MTVFTYAQPTFAVKHNNVYWDDAVLSLPALMVVDNAGQMATMTTVTDTVHLSQTFPIRLYGPAGQSWTGTVETDGVLNPQLNRTSGGDGDSLTIEVDTAGLLPGSYDAKVTISAAADMAGSPVEIPIYVFIVDHVFATYAPAVFHP